MAQSEITHELTAAEQMQQLFPYLLSPSLWLYIPTTFPVGCASPVELAKASKSAKKQRKKTLPASFPSPKKEYFTCLTNWISL